MYLERGEEVQIKNNRVGIVLHIYDQLNKGEVINKHEAAQQHQVSPKTISRYIADINNHLKDTHKSDYVCYSRKDDGYCMRKNNTESLNIKDIMTISKILLESRGLHKNEIEMIIEKLKQECSRRERSHITKMIGNEMIHYVQPLHGKFLVDAIWDISESIGKQRYLKIDYTKLQTEGGVSREATERIVQPEAILFSEYYFYLAAFIKGKDHDYPTIYRLDRIKNYQVMKEGFSIAYRDRFEPGEFRKLVQFMKPGELQVIEFIYCGRSIEAVADRLPTAEIKKQKDGTYVVKARVFGEGIKMWLLSQGKDIEILKPVSLKKELYEELQFVMGAASK